MFVKVFGCIIYLFIFTFLCLVVFFSISELSLNPFLILVTGFAGGFVSGFLGAGCGVVITPALFEFGLYPFTAVATQLCHAVGTNLSNFLSYKRKRDVDFHMAAYILLGGMIGAFCEWIILKYSPGANTAFQKFAYVYTITLIIFGVTMILQEFKLIKNDKTNIANGTAVGMASVMMRRWMLYLPLHKIFRRSRTEMSVFVPILVGFMAGIIVSAIGGGNNIFMAPIIIYLIGRMSPVVQGTSSFAGFSITMIVAFVYAGMGYICDLPLVIILFSGATLGSWLGVYLTYHVKRIYTNAISAIVVFIMAIRMIYKIIYGTNDHQKISNVLHTPSDIVSFTGQNPMLYTGICVTLLCLIAIVFEKIFATVIKRKRSVKDNKQRLK